MTTQYINKAILNGTTIVYWTTTGAADPTGASSGYNPENLTNIGVDYTGTYVSSVSSGFVGTVGGDLSGTYPNPTVAKINGHTVVYQNLSSAQDGYVLTWDNADGYWYAKAGVTGGGGGAISAIELSFVSDNISTTSAVFQRIGGRSVDMSKWAETVSGLTRTVSFYADVQKTSGATSVEIQLYDATDGYTITGTNLTSTSNSLTTVSATGLIVNSSNGNIRNDKIAQYEVQMKMNGGGVGDAVSLTNARLLISYA